MKNLITVIALFVSISTVTAQELLMPSPSPSQKLTQSLGLSEVSLRYSRPSANGRVVFGDLVPMDKVWRTGANESTKITFGEAVKLEGQPVAAGTYALYSIPGKTEWTIIISKNTGWWGAYDYTEEDDLLRFTVKPENISQPVETFTLSFDNLTESGATLTLSWERVRVPIRITTDVEERVMKSIAEVMSPSDRKPYLQAASYYYRHDKDLATALAWVNKAIELEPKAYWAVLLKARIQVKMKDYKGAKASAESVIAMAREENNHEYITLGQKVIDEAK